LTSSVSVPVGQFSPAKSTALLALEDGTWYQGLSVGAPGEAGGELVFNTSMTGYQEILTDPSYAGQIVTMTIPEIGNYGVTPEDVESVVPRVAGFVVREASPLASNWRARATLGDYLVEHGIVAIAGIDTRALTRRLRSVGVMRAVVATGILDPAALVRRARDLPAMEGSDLVKEVTCQSVFEWPSTGAGKRPPSGLAAPPEAFAPPAGRSAGDGRFGSGGPLVAAYDFGIKWNILRRLAAYGCRIRVFPAAVPAADVLAVRPDGVFLSNGPGDPAALGYAVENTRRLLDAGVPVFGICLGHQILALALGGRTYKLKFGHRGANHPVKRLGSGMVEITSQNHGFAVDAASLPGEVELTHVSLYDGTVEGFRHRSRPVFCVQYHPEASPGPHDADYLFARFLETMARA
jgi:carbamoyl-phosphate synthase small subunit